MLCDIAGVAHLRKCTNVTRAGAADDFAPIGVIGLGELRESHSRALFAEILNLVGQFYAIDFLTAAKKTFAPPMT